VSETVELELLNAKHDLADFFIDRRDKVEKWGRSPQGSTCIYQTNHQENVDAAKALIHKLVIPPNSKINHIRIWCYGEKYRTYEKDAAAGGGTLATSSDTLPATTSSGASSLVTSGATAPDTVSSGPSSPNTSESESAHAHTWTISGTDTTRLVFIKQEVHGAHKDCIRGNDSSTETTEIHSNTTTHAHGLANHIHSYTMPYHSHSLGNHTHQCQAALHHHTVSLENHNHPLTFGIYEAASATAQISLTITDPDGTPHDLGVLGTGEFAKEDLEVTQYFSKTGVYTFTFSADALGRVRSIVFAQVWLEPD